MSSPVFHKVRNLLFSSAVDAQDQARLLAVMQKEAGSWLEGLPVHLHLSDNELRIDTSLRLGVPTCTEHTCICNEKVGILGTHGLNTKIKWEISIYTTMRERIYVAEKGILDAEKYVGAPSEQRCARRPGREGINI